jgi:hypothetical protein
MRTSSWTSNAAGSTPRTETLSRAPVRVTLYGCTRNSGETSGSPSEPCAIPSKKRTAWYASSGSELAPSLVAPLRSTIRFFGEPAPWRLCFRLETSPESSPSASTTRAITPTASRLRERRTHRLRTL